jgi:hypothetical protein
VGRGQGGRQSLREHVRSGEEMVGSIRGAYCFSRSFFLTDGIN